MYQKHGFTIIELVIFLSIIILIFSFGTGINSKTIQNTISDKEIIALGTQFETRIISYYHRHAKTFPDNINDSNTLELLGVPNTPEERFSYSHTRTTFLLQAKISTGIWTSAYSNKSLT